MTKSISLEKLLEKYFILQEKEIRALRAEDARAYNRLYDRIWNTLEAIILSGDDGKRAVEALLNHDEPLIRLRSCQHVIQWNPDLAVPVLGKLAARQGNFSKSGFEAFSIVCDSQVILSFHFNGEGNLDFDTMEQKLKEAYGIELPPGIPPGTLLE